MSKPRFIDLFAGCGGLSLGLCEAGWQGLFAIERSPLAFETLKHNLAAGARYQFDWPEWLPMEAMTCEELLEGYLPQLESLQGKVELIVGGPPCQGFSTAGKRNPNDPRNRMAEQYLKVVEAIHPDFIVIENVAGFNMRFESRSHDAMNTLGKNSYASYIKDKLDNMGYEVSSSLINCAHYGVPQNRNRFLLIGESRQRKGFTKVDVFSSLLNARIDFLKSKNLPTDRPVTVYESISDLEVKRSGITSNKDSGLNGYNEIKEYFSEDLSAYQKLMRDDNKPNSLRLARHKIDTVEYFKHVQKICRPGKCLSKSERELIGSRKHSLTVLAKDSPSPTITTLPDDILHYDEPRILTARENARIQSFPDWYAFQGKYTTGGQERKKDCPRYTQIGNAVPPLVSEVIGILIKKILWSCEDGR